MDVESSKKDISYVPIAVTSTSLPRPSTSLLEG